MHAAVATTTTSANEFLKRRENGTELALETKGARARVMAHLLLAS
jgi:hypothetical protein